MQSSRLDVGGGPRLIWNRLRFSLDRDTFSIHKRHHIPISYFLCAGDVWFSHRGTTYQNNSIVTMENIGEGNDALLCMTNLTSVNGSVRGDWYFPNGTTVFSTQEIPKTGRQMVVRLYRRRGGEEGIYHCEIAESMNVNQTIYIGVYSTSTGE